MPESIKAPKLRGEYNIEHSNHPYTVYCREHYRAHRLFQFTGICSLCKTGERKTELHHIDGNWKNHASNNLIELCRGCHTKQHYTRGRQIGYLKRKRGSNGRFA